MVHTKNDIGFCASIFFFVGILSYVPVNSQFTDLSCLQLQGDINIEPVNNAYDVVTSLGGSGYTRGESFQVILLASSGSSETTFRGILIQAKPVGSDTNVGYFAIPDAGEDEYLICPGPVEGALINTSNSVKNIPAFFVYTPPADVADIEITFIVVGENGIYLIIIVVSPDIYSVINYQNLANGTFRLDSSVGSTDTTEFDYVFTMVPTNSTLDIYIGEGISFEIGNGDQLGVGEIIPGQDPVRVIGDTFWLRIYIIDISVRPFKFLIVIYQFSFKALPQLQIPLELFEFEVTFYVIIEVKPGSIVNVAGINPPDFKYGTGRIVGDNEVGAGQVTVRLSKYNKYIWFCFRVRVIVFVLIISQCDIDPCDADPCAMGFCVPHNEVCDDYNCASLTATECAACCPNPCYNNGLCQYDNTALMSYSCQCDTLFSGKQCEEGQVTLRTGGGFDLSSFSVFIPVWKNFYIHFTVDPGSQVTILEVQGFVAIYGLGPVVKERIVDVSTRQFTVTGTEFWVCLAPNGAVQRFGILIG